MSNPLPTPPSNDIPGGLIKASDVSTLYAILSGNATNSISVDGAITASDVINAQNGIDVTAGAITAGGGLTIPSGETLSVAGTITVQNATTSDEPVALGQVLNNVNPTASGGTNVLGGTTLSETTASFTAPSAGFLLATLYATASAGNEAITASLSASLGSLTSLGDSGPNSYIQRILYQALPMTAGQATTLTGDMSVTTATNLSIMVTSVFLPNP